ncbi:NF-X1-type zinc finger protein NFXL1 [Platanthera zijinensis]|uniref:NF-X1-type zinc finger protein NFXL1 n=1 Tax=Platanthera zijinensis TaxID=2320716 RepID=A0AAP0GAX3_9ASPA
MSSYPGQRRNTAGRNRPTPTISSPTPNQEWIPRGSSKQIWVPRGSKSPGLPPTISPAVPHVILPDVPQTAQEMQDKLSRSAVKCIVCFDMVRRSAQIWSCSSCFSIFHLHCIRKWAHSHPAPISSGEWLCPACQTPQSTPARDLFYSCFCGRRRDPPYEDGLTPHSCGNPCGKSLGCPHICAVQCHPGPCPPCSASISRRKCPCGKIAVDRCCSSRGSPFTCGQPCNRLLHCHRHTCERSCHTGACRSCEKLLTATCFCGKKTEAALCGDIPANVNLDDAESVVFSCNDVCGRRLLCGNHLCRKNCHPGPCGECELLPGSIRACHCGKTKLIEERSSCLDPIPTCSQICERRVSCKSHFCGKQCHEGDCPPCPVYVQQRCRCGWQLRFVECHQLFDRNFVFSCERTCGQKKDCGRHRCSDRCCLLSKSDGKQLSGGEWDPHPCSLPCRKWLQCGSHTCPLLCHGGQCPPCLVSIPTEVTCACGKTSISPPVLCGTLAPSCPHPCLVPQPCGHGASHSCHFGDCPPCPFSANKDMKCNQLCQSTHCDSSPPDTLPTVNERNALLEKKKKKLACNEEYYASTITLPRLSSLHFVKNLSMFNVFSNLSPRNDSNWFMTIEEILNSLVLPKAGTGSSFKKEDNAAKKMEELWKLFIQAARPPPLILGLKYSVQMAASQFPGYRSSLD